MIKRPLVWAGVCLILLLAAGTIWRRAAGDGGSPLHESLRLPQEGEPIQIQGTAAQYRSASQGMRLSLKNILIQSKNTSNLLVPSKYQSILYTDELHLEPGDLVTARGELSFFEPAGNPGQFDAEAYYSSQKILFQLKNPTILEIREGPFSLEKFLHRLRRSLFQSYQDIFSPGDASVMATMSLGETGQTEKERKLLYQEGGIAHILAISGLHISLLGMGLYRGLRRLYLPVLPAALLSGAVMGAYLLMTGASVSASRAVVMFWFWLGAQAAGRSYDRVTSIFLAALLLLAGNPDHLTQASFLLSFLAVLSLAVLVPAIQTVFSFSYGWANALLSGIVLQAGMLPCVLFFFRQTPCWSFLINLAVVPLMPAVMGLGLLGGVAGMFCREAGIFLGAPCGYLLRLFDALCLLERRLPGGIFVTGQPSWAKLAVYYGSLGILLLLFRSRRLRKKEYKKSGRILWTLWFAAMLILLPVRPPKELEIYALDVEQGDALLIRAPSGMTALIDGGSSSVTQVWRYRIGETLKYFGIRRLDYVFLSHGDEDHVNGITEFLEQYEKGITGENNRGISLERLVHGPETEQEYRELEDLAKEAGIDVAVMEQGDFLCGEEAGEKLTITCLSPDSQALLGEKNQDSLVLLLQYGKFRMLFTGDMQKEGEKRLLESGLPLRADVLKVGHHGAANASSEVFLKAVHPAFAVISCAEKNWYGHPAPETLQRLEKEGCAVRCTAWEGAVRIATDGEGYTLETYREKRRK